MTNCSKNWGRRTTSRPPPNTLVVEAGANRKVSQSKPQAHTIETQQSAPQIPNRDIERKGGHESKISKERIERGGAREKKTLEQEISIDRAIIRSRIRGDKRSTRFRARNARLDTLRRRGQKIVVHGIRMIRDC